MQRQRVKKEVRIQLVDIAFHLGVLLGPTRMSDDRLCLERRILQSQIGRQSEKTT